MLSGGKAEKVGRVRCRRAGNVPVVLCRVVFMRLFSAGSRKPWGRVDISRMSPLASTGQCKWRTGVGVRRTSKDKVHFTFPGGGGEMAAAAVPGDPPHSSYGLRKDHMAGGTSRNSLTS